jgi:hypothetical protein
VRFRLSRAPDGSAMLANRKCTWGVTFHTTDLCLFHSRNGPIGVTLELGKFQNCRQSGKTLDRRCGIREHRKLPTWARSSVIARLELSQSF